MRVIIYALDLLSVFAFAYFGATAGIAQRFTFLGVLTCAFLPALGGGTIREMLLNHTPFYFYDYSYGLAVVSAALFAIAARKAPAIKRYMYMLDALGMAVFAYLGSQAALHAGLGLGGSMMFAALTACGGGILCDVVTRQMPHAFQHRLYMIPPLLLGVVFWAVGGLHTPWHIRWVIIGATFVLQIIITYKLFSKVPFVRYVRRAIFLPAE